MSQFYIGICIGMLIMSSLCAIAYTIITLT